MADATALGALHVASWYETYTAIMTDEMLAAQSVEARVKMWCEVLSEPEAFGDAKVFVAEDANCLVAFGSCGRQRDQALASVGYDSEIGGLYVFRSHQHRNVGRSIMARMSQHMAHSGYSGASLWVLRDNAPARAFYERLGGKVVGEKRDERFDATLVEIAYGWLDWPQVVR